ncbi:unnamed protein product [Echinostoma caproni]|uniref:Amidase domain-containing protein n=1 Tax=Echinostoma caproni TaxID=27848 RepID=A0A183A9X3_9TREM|nr:unnamed protein product [Echinostoma caproni]
MKSIIDYSYNWMSLPKAINNNNKLKEKHDQLSSRRKEVEKFLNGLSKDERKSWDDVVELDLDQLETRLRNKSLTPLQVLHAFQAKVLRLHDTLGNSGMCEFIREAEQEATDLTNNPRLSSEQSPLYGIPISLKELCAVKGYDCTIGLVKLIGQSKSEDSVVVRVLRKAGAVPFVLTATSQLALTTTGFNPVYGDMHNPNSKDHEPGGGSPIGIGTDLLGSIRIPSAFCGICGFKPTATRVSTIGVVELDPRMVLPPFRVSVGPMGKRVSDLVRVMQVLFDTPMYEMDPTVIPLPFRHSIYDAVNGKPLVIGYYDTFDDPSLIQTVPSVRRGIAQAVEVMRKKGYHVIPFSPPRPAELLQLILRAISPDGGQTASRLLSNEPLSEQTQAMRLMANTPDGLRGLLDGAARNNMGIPAAWAKMVQKLNRPQDLQEAMYQLQVYRREFLQAMEEAGSIDVILCPVWTSPAYAKGTPAYYTNPPMIYTGIYNAMDFPAGSVPIGRVTEEDVEESNKWAEERQKAKDRYHQRLFNMQSDTVGLPLAVQVAGKPYQDELVLRMMRELETGQNK